jgi:chemotaxis protein CheX
MNVKIINAFVDRTVNVLSTMAFVDSVAGAPYLKKNDAAHGDVSGIIGFTGSLVGSLAVRLNG